MGCHEEKGVVSRRMANEENKTKSLVKENNHTKRTYLGTSKNEKMGCQKGVVSRRMANEKNKTKFLVQENSHTKRKCLGASKNQRTG